MNLFKVKSKAIRYTGRWHVDENMAITTAPGGMIEIAFQGRNVILHFDIKTNQHPYPHLWIKVDNETKIEVPVDRYLRIETEKDEAHMITIIYKSVVEMQHRWYQPLIGKISFCGFEAEKEGTLPIDFRKTIEFIGDSITEGVLVDEDYREDSFEQLNRVYQDDAMATYAYKTALALNLKPVIMGYGATGITCDGKGAVPKAEESYPFCFHNIPIEKNEADYIVINHGTNDGRETVENYIIGMERFLRLVRKRNKSAKVAVMTPFNGVFHDELSNFIPEFNRKYNDSIFLVDTKGWLPPEPVHPDREGHTIAAQKLTEILKGWI